MHLLSAVSLGTNSSLLLLLLVLFLAMKCHLTTRFPSSYLSSINGIQQKPILKRLPISEIQLHYTDLNLSFWNIQMAMLGIC